MRASRERRRRRRRPGGAEDDARRMRARLEAIYRRYTRREYAAADPVRFLYRYPDVRDREIAGLVASSLAYGRVEQICASAAEALRRIGRPSEASREGARGIGRALAGFRHRFTAGDDIAALVRAAGRAARRHGSLEACFAAGMRGGDETVLPALSRFVRELAAGGGLRGGLLPDPAGGSACKRLNLFLRWMVRRDEVDPGGWGAVPAAMLVVPLDTHMFAICRRLGLTRRRRADLRAAVEATAAFRRIAPGDPVRYDFALTRVGMDGAAGRRRRAPEGMP
ncbi:MAG: TIGR02757 family protein [bacterium]|nr:TIGR02757 family protein [bacterium]